MFAQKSYHSVKHCTITKQDQQSMRFCIHCECSMCLSQALAQALHQTSEGTEKWGQWRARGARTSIVTYPRAAGIIISQHIWQQRNVARQLSNLSLIAISSLYRRQRDTCMTTTAEQFIAYRHEPTCHDYIILSLQARFFVSQVGSCCVKPIAVLHLTVDSSHIDWLQ